MGDDHHDDNELECYIKDRFRHNKDLLTGFVAIMMMIGCCMGLYVNIQIIKITKLKLSLIEEPLLNKNINLIQKKIY